jgi:hypothetical protein
VHPNGVLIETARGAKVRAPLAGRVVYADWLQGMGMLLIIAHAGNYLTLYGHAEVRRGRHHRRDERRGRCGASALFRDPRGAQTRRSEGLAQANSLRCDARGWRRAVPARMLSRR